VVFFHFRGFAVSLNLTRMGTLDYGDNLDILKRYIKDETVDCRRRSENGVILAV
jgi:hypothetical protein